MAERTTVRRVIGDKLLLVGLALVISAPIVLVFWIINRPPSEIASRDDLERVSDSETILVTRNLDDDALEELPRFEALQELQLNYSDITDAGMARLGECPALHTLLVHSDGITDVGLQRLSGLAELRELMLAGSTRITGDGLSVLQNFSKLRRLVIVRCPDVGDELAPHLRGLPLEIVDFEQSPDIGDGIVRALGGLEHLSHVNLNFCPNVTDEGIIAIARLPGLQVLLLHGLPRITDRALDALAGVQSLRHLELPLHSVHITEEGIAQLKKALPECEFNR
jgi:hypothetical protein